MPRTPKPQRARATCTMSRGVQLLHVEHHTNFRVTAFRAAQPESHVWDGRLPWPSFQLDSSKMKAALRFTERRNRTHAVRPHGRDGRWRDLASVLVIGVTR